MPLDPQCKTFLDDMAAGGGRPLYQMSPIEARARAMPAELAGPEQPVHHVEDRKIPGDGGLIPVRIYRPEGEGPLPALLLPRLNPGSRAPLWQRRCPQCPRSDPSR